jgi:hypothetical protein
MASKSFAGPNNTSAAIDEFLFVGATTALCGEWRPVLCQVVSSRSFGATANSCVIDVRNIGTDGTGTTNLSAAGFSNATTSIVADTVFNVPIEGPGNASPTAVFMADNEVLVLHFAQAGSGQNYSASATTFHVSLYGIQSPPSRSVFQR